MEGEAAVRPIVKRSEQGYRVGDSHHNSRAPDAAVRLARDLHEFDGMKPCAIARRLAEEFGLVVPVKTVQHWVYYTTRNVTPRDREDRVPTHRSVR